MNSLSHFYSAVRTGYRRSVQTILPAQYASSVSSLMARSYSGTSGLPYENLIVEARGEKKDVGYIQLHRPQKLNAISIDLSKELHRALTDFEEDDQIRAVVYTGGEKIFTVGADISVMAQAHFTFPAIMNGDFKFSLLWNKLHDFRKPIIAAVSGYCVGGGTETTMMCDIIYASETAQFGQPEINIGTLPGAGGTQRLIKAMKKSKAMEAVLTGDRISAQQALASGLISKTFPVNEVIPAAINLAERIASKPRVATLMAKEAIKLAFELPLASGLRYERRLSRMLTATKDFREGTSAFVEKRPPVFTD